MLRPLLLAAALAPFSLPSSAMDIDAAKPDPAIEAAMAKSQAGLAAFDAAIAKNEKAMLDVRVPYGEGRSELVWLGGVRRNHDGSYDGIVVGDVAHVPDVFPGTFLHARRDQVADWVYEDEKGDHGGFTVKLMREHKGFLDGFHFAD